MDQTTFTNLTGISLSSSQAARFSTVVELTDDALQEVLGWPLDPDDWDNQYLEIGKTKDEWDCFSGDTSDLLPADDIIGLTRLYTWNPVEPYIFIDPATVIHAVKIVRNGITYKTFKPTDYNLQLQNGPTTFGRYINVRDELHRRLLFNWPLPLLVFEHSREADLVQVAIDADWGFDDLPTQLQKVQADMIYYELNVNKRDLKSESMLSHSYSKNAHPDPLVTHADIITKYVGPHGTAYEELILV